MKKIIYLFFVAFATFSCTEDFTEINTNTNQPETVSADLLLPTVIFNFSDLAVLQNNDFGHIIGQYTANYEFNNLDLFNWSSDGRYWGIYSQLQNIKEIENYGKNTSNPNYEAIAIILRAYGVSLLTDIYGDVPFTEAVQGDTKNFTPVYDSQESIYKALLADLEKANTIINTNSVKGDILFGGDMTKWKKFGNSLRLRMLLRSSNKMDNSAAMSSIISDLATNPIISTNEDNAIYEYSGSLPNLSPYSVGRGRPYDYYLGVPTTHIINLLKENNDPRLMEWFDPKKETTEYIGVAPGLTLKEVGRPINYASKAASYFDIANKMKGVFMTTSEVHFILAEAIERNIISGDAKMYYDKAVELSFEEAGVKMPDNFLTTTAPYNADNESLETQKWISLFHNPLQGWLTWKRNGLPSFIKAGPATTNNGEIPVRMMYPSIEQSVNKANYNAAVSKIGGDNINTRIWWDK